MIRTIEARSKRRLVRRHRGGAGEPGRAPTLLGLIAEHVSDLTYTQPEQIVPLPSRCPRLPTWVPSSRPIRGSFS